MELTYEEKKRLIKKIRTDIIWFVNKLIIDPFNKNTGNNYFITNQQREGLKALQKLVEAKIAGEQQDIQGISIMSGKGTGKDAFTVWCILWFMMSFPFPKVPCVSVSSDQLDKVLWSELSKWLSPSEVKEFFVLQSDKLFFKDVPDDVRGKEWFAFKKAANPKSAPNEQVETLQGLHADYMLQVIDEGSGILDPVYSALENNQTSKCNIMLIIFNPMHAKGYAVETQYARSKYWITLNWNSEDSEITNKGNHKRLEEKYGRESNPYRMNVLGLPPLFDEQTLIPWDWVMAAIDRDILTLPDMAIVKGVDCGAGGDKSIIATRHGNKVKEFRRNNTSDSIELANWIGSDIDADHPDCVRVDTIGIGWAVEGMLREKKGAIIEAADCRRQADEPERFENKRAEMYWNLREQFEKGSISIPNDSDLLEQISATRYETDKRGRIKIIEKKKIKNEIGHSPDEFDAMAMLYFYRDISFKKSFNYDYEYDTTGSWMSN